MIFFLRTLALVGCSYSAYANPGKLDTKVHGSFMFLLTLLISVDNTKMHKHFEKAKYLQKHRTGYSSTCNIVEWRRWAQARFQGLIDQQPSVAVRTIQHAFWGRPLCELSRRNVAVALRTLFTTYEVYERIDTFEADVKEIETMLSPLHPFSEKPTAHNFIRPNNDVTTPGLCTPIYYPLVVTIPRTMFRLAANAFISHVQGFTRRVDGKTMMVYWSRISDIQKPTVVFMHGIGLGVIPYLHMLSKMCQVAGAPNVILVEFPGISGHSVREEAELGFPPYPSAEEVAKSIREHLSVTVAPHSRVIGIAHSFGTMVLSNIMNTFPDTFSRTAYIDPVCFFEGATTLWPVLYSPLTITTFFESLREVDPVKFITHLAAGDIYTQHVIKNVMYFAEYANRGNDMKPLLVLSGKDHLVDTRAVRDCAKEDSEIWFYENWIHGDFLFHPSFQRRLGVWLGEAMKEVLFEDGEYDGGNLMKQSKSCPVLEGLHRNKPRR
ncbi:hypothetical protein TrVE_jg12816 [Triparma verrucosa]|uniref:AB hydrolase-1 domain-containing protein n=1 Tax=Triparma verrucosa TaxID=1606542 RepID=A0A9W7CKP9_9STRA|nr:hypothetical protein TrVE_jg12816 [Triparma verrucosa]